MEITIKQLGCSNTEMWCWMLEWRIDEPKKLDRKTRKLLTMQKGLHPNSDVDGVYVSRNVTLADEFTFPDKFTLEDWCAVKLQLEVKKMILDGTLRIRMCSMPGF